MSNESSNAIKVIALSAASLALLSACGEPTATPMDDEYAGNSGESVQSQEENSKNSGNATDSGDSADTDVKNHADDSNSTTSDKQDTGNYADGTYSINGQYGPVSEDTIDVHGDGQRSDRHQCGGYRASVHVHLQKAPECVRRSHQRRGGRQAAQRPQGRQGGRCQLDVGSVQQGVGCGPSGSVNPVGPVAAKSPQTYNERLGYSLTQRVIKGRSGGAH